MSLSREDRQYSVKGISRCTRYDLSLSPLQSDPSTRSACLSDPATPVRMANGSGVDIELSIHEAALYTIPPHDPSASPYPAWIRAD